MNNNPRGQTSLAVLRGLLQREHNLQQDIHNVTQVLFPAGTKLEYQVSERRYFGQVVAVHGVPGTTRLRVTNLGTGKEREIALTDITGVVQEE
jgi:hypothetical protein